MNHVERFRAVMDFQPVDRLPRWEWAMWWDETVTRWKQQGLPSELESVFEIAGYFGLDPYQQFWFSTTDDTIDAVQHHVEGIVSNMDDYLRLRPRFFPDHGRAIESMRPWAARQARGEAVVWITLEGYFWFPRTLMGFTKVSLAFYDQPELIHRINQDLTDFDFNKMVMDKGEAAMRAEFERLLPLMRSGGFIPSVDHQTPPHVTIEQYRLYRRLLDEYTAAAGQSPGGA